MALGNPTYIHQLDPFSPSATDPVAQGDDHIRSHARALKNTFPNIKGEVTLSHTQLNELSDLLASVGDLKSVAAPFVPNAKYWQLCDGRTVPLSDGSDNITLPDLRGKVLINALDGSYAAGQSYGTKTRSLNTTAAGAHGHTADISAAGDHTHDVSVNVQNAKTGISATLNTRKQDNDGGSGATNVESVTINDPGHVHGATGSTGAAGNHKHTATVSNAGDHQHSVEFDVIQPSYTVNTYMRV